MGNGESKLGTLNAAEQKDTLNRFFNDLYNNMLQLQESDQVIFDIREAVRETVRDIATKIGDIDSRLKIGEIILVGSAMEGTRNISPNEYDFLLVLDVLSLPGVISVTQDCRDSESHVHITIENDNMKTQFRDMLQGGKLVGTNLFSERMFSGSLRHLFWNVIEMAVHRLFDCASVKTSTGILSFNSKSVELHGPAFKLMLKWQGNDGTVTEISVDLCPVIRYRDYHNLVKPENAGCQTYYECLQRVQSVMLMPLQPSRSKGLCFNLTFTLTELMLMMDLSEHHKKCYKVLKYLLNGRELITSSFLSHIKDQFLIGSPTALSSFVLKMFALSHHYKQQCQGQCLVECIGKMLREISSFMETIPKPIRIDLAMETLPGLFFPVKVKYDYDLKHSLEAVLRNLENISQMEKYDFENCRLEGVICADGKRVSHVTQMYMCLFTCTNFLLYGGMIVVGANLSSFLLLPISAYVAYKIAFEKRV